MSPENNNMSLHDEGLSQGGETGTTGRKQSYRLYPSLPNIDRYEVCVPVRSTGEKRRAAAADDPDGRLGDTQSETAGSDFRLKAQILILEEQRRELLSINEKWAKEYRTMKQYYREKTVQMDARSELLKAEREAKELRAQNSTLTRRWEHHREEISRLNKALEDSLQATRPLEASSETLQDVWKHQAEVYKEDFLKERRDREKLKGKYLELEKKFKKVHSELLVFKPQVTRTRPPQPVVECTCTNQAKCPSATNQPQVQLQRRYTLDNKQ